MALPLLTTAHRLGAGSVPGSLHPVFRVPGRGAHFHLWSAEVCANEFTEMLTLTERAANTGWTPPLGTLPRPGSLCIHFQGWTNSEP